MVGTHSFSTVVSSSACALIRHCGNLTYPVQSSDSFFRVAKVILVPFVFLRSHSCPTHMPTSPFAVFCSWQENPCHSCGRVSRFFLDPKEDKERPCAFQLRRPCSDRGRAIRHECEQCHRPGTTAQSGYWWVLFVHSGFK